MLKAIIFDLDDTLFDSTELSERARFNAAEAMINAGLPAKSAKEVFQRIDEIVQKYGSNYPKHFSRLCEEYKIKPKPEIIAAGMVAYHNVKISQIHLFPKVQEILFEFAKDNYFLALITVGNPIKQWEKIIRLNIKQYFKVIQTLDEKETKSKKIHFENFLTKSNFNPKEVLCIGDRIDSEIKDAKKIGIQTIRIIQGKYKHLTPKNKYETPDYSVKNFEEILKIINENSF